MSIPGIRRVTKGASLGKLKLLIYGKRGTGKTHLACTASDTEDLGPVLHIALEPTDATLEERGDIDSISPPALFEKDNQTRGTADYVPSLEKLIDMHDAGDEALTQYKCWIIDSATELEEMNLESIRLKNSKNAMLELQDYGKNTNGLTYIFRRLRDMQQNVIILALEDDIVVGQGNNSVVKGVRPALTKKIAKRLLGYVDHVHYLKADDEGNRWLYVKPTQKFEAKTRGADFLERLDKMLPANPTMADVMDIYHNRYTPPESENE